VNGVHGSPATGYRIYASIDGLGFDGGTFVSDGSSNTATLTGLDTDKPYYFKVVAENAGGQSEASEVMAVLPDGGNRQVLIVNGFDRVDRSRNFKQPYLTGGTVDRVWERYGNRRDYTATVSKAIHEARPGIRVDSSSNEAVINGTIALADYESIVWILGTESTANDTFSAAEQTLVESFISGGGDLFVSGAETAYDLDFKDNGRDFYRNNFGASYASDDAGTYRVSPDAGGIFSGQNAFTFSNGSQYSSLDNERYDVAFPDVLTPQSGSLAALRYGAPSGGVAAIEKVGVNGAGNVVNLGFPFETIEDAAIRSGLMDRVLGFFEVEPPAANPPKVIDVILGASSWHSTMIDAVDGMGVDAGNGLGVSLVGSDQLVNLPWTGINRIYIRFSEDVSSHFTLENVKLRGGNVIDYGARLRLVYGQDGANVGTIELDEAIQHDAILLSLSEAILDQDSIALDGEWVDSVSMTSGDATPGGQFDFRIDVLPGDFNDNGGVNTTDVLAINQNRGQLTSNAAIARADTNGHGAVNTSDVMAANSLRGTVLPDAPTLPVFNPSANVVAASQPSLRAAPLESPSLRATRTSPVSLVQHASGILSPASQMPSPRQTPPWTLPNRLAGSRSAPQTPQIQSGNGPAPLLTANSTESAARISSTKRLGRFYSRLVHRFESNFETNPSRWLRLFSRLQSRIMARLN
jgi:hypothetical protein